MGMYPGPSTGPLRGLVRVLAEKKQQIWLKNQQIWLKTNKFGEKTSKFG